MLYSTQYFYFAPSSSDTVRSKMAPMITAITTSAPTLAVAHGQCKASTLQARSKGLRAFLKPLRARQAVACPPHAAAADVVQVQSYLVPCTIILSDSVFCIVSLQCSGACTKSTHFYWSNAL